MRVTIEVPSPDEQCPLTMSPMCEDALEFIPSETYVASTPEAKKITLPCGHSFGAMSITYHFARRDMRCPCCRAGHKQRLKLESVPFHFRAKLAAQVYKADQDDIDEQTIEDERVAQELESSGMVVNHRFGPSAISVIQDRPAGLSVYLYNNDTDEAPSATFEFNLLMMSEPAVIMSVTYRLSTIHGRFLWDVISDNMVSRMAFVAHTRHVITHAVVELARTEIVSSRDSRPDPGPSRFIPAGVHATFEILQYRVSTETQNAIFVHVDMRRIFNVALQ